MLNELITRDTTHTDIAEQLSDYAKHSEGAYADNTERARRADWNKFSTYCDHHALQSLPAAPTTTASFIDEMAKTCKPATIKRYLATISAAHTAAGLNKPTDHMIVKLAMKRLLKSQTVRQQQADPIGWAFIEQVLLIEKTGPRDVLDETLLLVGYDSMCRASELVSIQVEDISVNEDGAGSGTVLIRRSKVDQSGEGAVKYLSARTMEAIALWLETSGIGDGYLFKAIGRHDYLSDKQLSTKAITRSFKRSAEKIGISAENISGHSCRVGSCQDLTSANISLPAIMQSGGWKTAAMPARYAERLSASKGAMAQLSAIQGR